jgi:hypothetical protein
VTALNAMHQRPDATPLRAWWAESYTLHAQHALVAIVSGHGLPKGRLVATEIQADELWRERVRHEGNVGAHGSTKGTTGQRVRYSTMEECRWEYTQSCHGIRYPKARYKIEGTVGKVLRGETRGERWTNEGRQRGDHRTARTNEAI